MNTTSRTVVLTKLTTTIQMWCAGAENESGFNAGGMNGRRKLSAASDRAPGAAGAAADGTAERYRGVEKHLECRSTVSRGHFSTGTHGHLHLSHFLHDPDTFIEVRGRAASTRSAELQG